jgi:integrase
MPSLTPVPTAALRFAITIALTPEGQMTVSGQPLGTPSGPILRLFDPTGDPVGDNRTIHPVVTNSPERPRRRWVLRSVFTLLLWRPKRDELATASWYDYRTLLTRWEGYWTATEGRPSRGPDVRDITDAMLLAFFRSQPGWATARTWAKYRDLFAAILKTCLVRSANHRSGPRAGDALLTELPYFEMPADRFFAGRTSPARRGGHFPSRESLLAVPEIDLVIRRSEMATFPCWDGCDPQAFWRAFFACMWTFGPRLRNLLRMPRESVDWRRALWNFNETKKGNEVWVPIPPAVMRALEEVNRGSREWLLPIPKGQVDNLDRNFYPTYKRIWQWAGLPLRMPHQLRATAVSHWKEHAPEWRKWVTGHSRKGDVQDAHYVILGEKFRQAVLTFPQPASLLEST